MSLLTLPPKPRIVMTILSLLIASACDDQLNYVVPAPGTPGSPGSPGTVAPNKPTFTDFSSYMNTRMATNFTTTDQYLRRYGSNILYNYQRFAQTEMAKVLSDLGVTGMSASSFASQLNLSSLGSYSGNVLPAQVPNASAVFTSAQLSLLGNYVNNMYSATSSASATSYYHAAVAAVNAAFIRDNHKAHLKAIIQILDKFAQNYFSGAYRDIIVDVSTVSGRSARGGSCVDWRNAWRSGVVGGVIGGVAGAYTGATVGTVSFPVIGTVTGGVAGGVIGFAAGFFSGAGQSILQDVIFNCIGGSATVVNYDCSRYTDSAMRLQCQLDHNQLNKVWTLTPF